MAKQTFTTGQVLTAAQVTALQTNDYNQTVNSKTANYVLVATDVGTRISMNSASATTITVNTSLFAAGDQVYVVNIGAGTCTITAGTATVTTSGSLALGQYDSGTLYFTATGSAIFFSATSSNDIPKSILTTTGDTLYASAASTPARLAIGTTGQVLTVASGLPSWATPSVSSNKGCFLYLSADATTTSGAEPITSWTAESWDTDNFHSLVTNTSRITIPTGLGGKYLVILNNQFNANATGRRISAIKVNGTTVRDTEMGVPTSSGYLNAPISTILSLSAGDYIESSSYQTSGGNLTLIGTAARSTSLCISYLGA
jgi:hypothetical protein